MLCILPECTFAGFLAHHRRGKAQHPLGPQLAQEALLPSAAALETWLRSGQQNPNWGIRICAESHKKLPAQKVTRVSKSFLISQANSNSSYHWLGVRSFDDDFLSASTAVEMCQRLGFNFDNNKCLLCHLCKLISSQLRRVCSAQL